jgi:hypothetical protein
MELFRLGGWDQIFAEMEKKYMNNAGTALATIQKSRKISVRFVTSLDDETCDLMGYTRISPEEAGDLLATETGQVAWIGNASLLYK